MRVLLTTCGSRRDVQPLAGLAVQVRALGAEVQVCAPPDQEFAELLAGVGAAAAEECDAPVATGVMPTGGWR
jgi:vancomycin aglycone glucosyltransferase